jgi:aryl-alcohol dehydrogenase-like predicted oxidoreductase
MYSDGASERIIGKAIKKYQIPRSRLVILSKCYFGVCDVHALHPELSSSVVDLNRR